ncbi:MAG: acetolactate synthase small subunit [Xanthomonadales bacterium]|uniref:acetolactate synthase small subunit n=1 Tax=Dokdonella sp. TaxID=2291710 RepID=UPI002C25A8A3|nr:acetolactate synthase small subunit [Xanthomonadales bacterium]HQV71983.1 acetolactate synthase small subunit [Dokdonella sp.]MBK7011339.1 acetolactate synthase small subunit [Xanthomonadales bacterium]MBK7211155.1 acetolactate synthase small subunit [Xanthomonadales bacterium]MBL0221666.1 acetolactate synthase small subunit [Xanthomonadales bacterium]
MRHIISMLLQNEAGALARVAGMFSARGYNIDSLTVAATHDPEVSRLTLVTFGDDAVIAQIIKQSRKYIDVLEIADLTSRDHLECELLVVKVSATPANAAAIREFTQRQGGMILDESATTRVLQFTASGAAISTILDGLTRMAPILELARSGTAAIERGASVLGLAESRLAG